MREKYGSYFKCIIPGIAHNEGMPVCDHFTISFERNDSLGTMPLMSVKHINIVLLNRPE